MRISSLEWDDINLEHISSNHHLSPKEIADVCFGRHLAFAAKYKRIAIFGQASSGKYIKVILERLYGSIYRPITAYGMTRQDQQKYKSIMRQG